MIACLYQSGAPPRKFGQNDVHGACADARCAITLRFRLGRYAFPSLEFRDPSTASFASWTCRQAPAISHTARERLDHSKRQAGSLFPIKARSSVATARAPKRAGSTSAIAQRAERHGHLALFGCCPCCQPSKRGMVSGGGASGRSSSPKLTMLSHDRSRSSMMLRSTNCPLSSNAR